MQNKNPKTPRQGGQPIGPQLSVEEQLQLLAGLEERHDEVLRLLDDLENRVSTLLRNWTRDGNAAATASLSPSQVS